MHAPHSKEFLLIKVCTKEMNFPPSSQELTGTLDISKPHKQSWEGSRKLRHPRPWSQSWGDINFLECGVWPKATSQRTSFPHETSLLCQNLIKQLSHFLLTNWKCATWIIHGDGEMTSWFENRLIKARNHSKMCEPRYRKENEFTRVMSL